MKVLALVGPTASGKTKLAVELALEVGGEIVSVDSAQVYRRMNIGTAKPDPEDLEKVKHHLIDVVEPDVTLTVAEFQRMARLEIERAAAAGKPVILVGGSGLYFRAVVDPIDFPGTDPSLRRRVELEAEEVGAEQMYARLRELDPEAATRIEPGNIRRTVRALEVIDLTGRPFSSFRTGWDGHESIYDLKVSGISWPREELDARISNRVDMMMSAGLLEEVRSLSDAGFRESLTSVQAIGYRQLLDHVDGNMGLEEAVEEIKTKTRRFARRQLSWFGSDPRVIWFEAQPLEAASYLAATARV